MKLQIDETISVEFDEWALTRAGKDLKDIKQRHGERADDILNGLLTLLLFRQIEISAPGTVDRIISACGSAKSQSTECEVKA